jgi:hypothetical protein
LEAAVPDFIADNDGMRSPRGRFSASKMAIAGDRWSKNGCATDLVLLDWAITLDV